MQVRFAVENQGGFFFPQVLGYYSVSIIVPIQVILMISRENTLWKEI